MIRDIPKCERPRERLIAYGVEALSNEELLAIILKSGTRNKSVKSLASEVLNNAVEIDRLKDCGINLLTSINGIGETKACEVLASIELGKRIYLIGQKNKYKIKTSKDVYDLMKYEKLVEIGRIQAIPIIDHIIVGDDSYYSMAESLDLFGGRV